MNKPNIVIDYIKPGDNEAVLDLSHRCIQHGMLSVYPDRSPDFTRIHKQLDKRTFHLVARHNDKLIGCLGGIHTPVQHDGIVYDSIYMLDFKVDPEHQKGLTAYRLVKEAYERTFGLDEKMGFATIIKGNEASHIFTRGRAGFPGSTNLGNIIVNNIIPVRKKNVNRRFRIEKPIETDIKELVDLYGRFYRTYKLAPYMTEELFRYYLDEIDGMNLENMWIARENGKIQAVLCAWDEDIYKRWVVMRIPFGMKIAFGLIRFLSVFLKMPAPLKTGEALRQKTLVMMVHDNNIEALKNLVRHIINIHRGSEYTVIQSHIHKDDEMGKALVGLFGMKVETEVHMLTADPKLSESIFKSPGPVLLEWPMFI